MRSRELRRLAAVLAMPVVLWGCAEYELFTDNATFLDGALDMAARRVVADLGVQGNTTVAVVNMENPVDPDVQPNAKVHDALVAALLVAGAVPVERDDDILVRLVNEASESLEMAATTRNAGEGRSFQ